MGIPFLSTMHKKNEVRLRIFVLLNKLDTFSTTTLNMVEKQSIYNSSCYYAKVKAMPDKMFALLVFLFIMSGCSLAPKQSASIYTRMGGMEVINQVVDETIEVAANHPKTKRSFDGIKLKNLKESVASQLCFKTGGGCEYEGETMKNSHADADITTAEFEVFVQIFRDALNKHVGEREKNEILQMYAPMKRDIVTQ